MSETYCPECKQNVPKGASCANCGYEFVEPEGFESALAQAELMAIDADRKYTRGYIQIPRAELEELVGAYEVMITIASELAARLCIPARDEFVKARAAKFRDKYLGGDGELANLIWTAPLRNNNGALCGLCDGTDAHEHPQLQCAQCGVVGLSENMPRHKCKTEL